MSINNKAYKFNNDKANSIIFQNGKVEGKIEENVYNNNLYVVKSDFLVKEDTIVNSSYNIDGIVLGFIKEGRNFYKSNLTNLTLDMLSNKSSAVLANEMNATSSLKKGNVKSINIILKKEFLEENLEEGSFKDFVFNSLDKGICNTLLSSKKTNHHIQLLLNEIATSPFESKMDKLFIQSKVLEIIYNEFNILQSSNKNISNTKVKFDQYDIEAIKKAKDILIQNMQNPPSILELARLVKLNDFKLKLGFKRVYGTTPYGLLMEYRLDLSKKLLLDSDMNINEISELIGYRFHQSFSAAFVKRFGVRPKDIMKNRKYYY